MGCAFIPTKLFCYPVKTENSDGGDGNHVLLLSHVTAPASDSNFSQMVRKATDGGHVAPGPPSDAVEHSTSAHLLGSEAVQAMKVHVVMSSDKILLEIGVLCVALRTCALWCALYRIVHCGVLCVGVVCPGHSSWYGSWAYLSESSKS